MMENQTAKKIEDILNLPPEMEAIVKSKGGLPKIMSHVPKAAEYEAQAEKFKALSSSVRLQIMHSLLVADLCPSIMKKITGMSDSKLSYHLDILESAGFIVHMQSQKWRIYAITLEGRKAIGHLKQESDIPMV